MTQAGSGKGPKKSIAFGRYNDGRPLAAGCPVVALRVPDDPDEPQMVGPAKVKHLFLYLRQRLDPSFGVEAPVVPNLPLFLCRAGEFLSVAISLSAVRVVIFSRSQQKAMLVTSSPRSLDFPLCLPVLSAASESVNMDACCRWGRWIRGPGAIETLCDRPGSGPGIANYRRRRPLNPCRPATMC